MLSACKSGKLDEVIEAIDSGFSTESTDKVQLLFMLILHVGECRALWDECEQGIHNHA